MVMPSKWIYQFYWCSTPCQLLFRKLIFRCWGKFVSWLSACSTMAIQENVFVNLAITSVITVVAATGKRTASIKIWGNFNSISVSVVNIFSLWYWLLNSAAFILVDAKLSDRLSYWHWFKLCQQTFSKNFSFPNLNTLSFFGTHELKFLPVDDLSKRINFTKLSVGIILNLTKPVCVVLHVQPLYCLWKWTS